MEKEVMYISYEDAQKVIPFFKAAVENAPFKEAKESANRILQEIKFVRGDVKYTLGGYQVFLIPSDKDFYIDALNALEDK